MTVSEASSQTPPSQRAPRRFRATVVALASIFALVVGVFAGGVLGAGAQQSITAPQVSHWKSIAQRSDEHAAVCRKQVELLLATQAPWGQAVLAASQQDDTLALQHIAEMNALISSLEVLEPC